MDTTEDFEAFYLRFLTSHTRAITRWMHVAGIGAGVTGAAISIATRRPLPAVIGAAVGTALAVGSHPLFEGNVPQNAGRPFWGARALVRMCFRQVTGAIDADLTTVAGMEH